MDELTKRNEAIARRNASARRARRITFGTAAAATAGVGVVAGVVATPKSVSHTDSARQLLAATPSEDSDRRRRAPTGGDGACSHHGEPDGDSHSASGSPGGGPSLTAGRSHPAGRDMRPAALSRPPATFSLRALGTTALVVVAEPDALPSARETLIRQLRAVDLACSRFRPDSELVKLNARGRRPSTGRPRCSGTLSWPRVETARSDRRPRRSDDRTEQLRRGGLRPDVPATRARHEGLDGR